MAHLCEDKVKVGDIIKLSELPFMMWSSFRLPTCDLKGAGFASKACRDQPCTVIAIREGLDVVNELTWFIYVVAPTFSAWIFLSGLVPERCIPPHQPL